MYPNTEVAAASAHGSQTWMDSNQGAKAPPGGQSAPKFDKGGNTKEMDQKPEGEKWKNITSLHRFDIQVVMEMMEIMLQELKGLPSEDATRKGIIMAKDEKGQSMFKECQLKTTYMKADRAEEITKIKVTVNFNKGEDFSTHVKDDGTEGHPSATEEVREAFLQAKQTSEVEKMQGLEPMQEIVMVVEMQLRANTERAA